MSAKLVVQAVPKARKTEVVRYEDGILKVRIAAPPANGEANNALIVYLAKLLNRAKNEIVLRMGFGGRNKIFEINGLDAAELQETLTKLFPQPRGK